MASENEIKRELEELNSNLYEISRRPPFDRDENYLGSLAQQLTRHLRQSDSDKRLAGRLRFTFPVWARGIAAALLLLIPGYIFYKWMNPDAIEYRVIHELRQVDAVSIEAYLQQGCLEVEESGASKANTDSSHWHAEQDLAVLDPSEIENYLNAYPSLETSQN